MEVTIVEREPMTIVGWQAKFIHSRSPETNAASVIGNLWRNVFKFDVLKAMPGSLGHPTWGVIWGDPVQQRARIDELNYLAGVPFVGMPALPEGIRGRNVPGGTYARITHRGPLSGLPATIEHLYATWLPGSGYEHASQCDLELYDERFFKEGPEQEFDYFISVKPAPAMAAVESAPAPQVTIASAVPKEKDSEETGKRSRSFNEKKRTDALRSKAPSARSGSDGSKEKRPAKKKTGARSASDGLSSKRKRPAKKSKAAKGKSAKKSRRPAKKPAKIRASKPRKPAKKKPVPKRKRR